MISFTLNITIYATAMVRNKYFGINIHEYETRWQKSLQMAHNNNNVITYNVFHSYVHKINIKLPP